MTELATLIDYSERVAATRSTHEKVALIAELLGRVEQSEIPFVVAALSGQFRQGRIGIGYAVIRAARAQHDAAHEQLGLFDDHAVSTAPLGVRDVDRALSELARVAGRGSGGKRLAILEDLFARASDGECRFIEHLLLAELRQGALGGVMEDAVAYASGIAPQRIRRAAMLAGDLSDVAVAALTRGESGLDPFRLTLFRPVRPMLAQPAADVDEALARHGVAAVELKLDGARVQIHREGDRVAVFSRQLNDVTASLPEVVTAIHGLPVDEVVLDGEVIALRADGTPLPFQVTMRRFGRRLDVGAAQADIPLTAVLFDILRLNGEDLFDRPERERRTHLERVAAHLCVERRITRDTAEGRSFFERALAKGHEGVMVKSLDAPYSAGGRGSSWLKVKSAHTLDLVVLAVEWGSGRRSRWLSNLHLGARNSADGGFTMLGKTFKGMTDEMLAWQTDTFQRLAVAREGNVVHVRPEVVVEIAFNDVQQSPRYPGGMALRLARVVRYRPDKTAAEADTVEAVQDLFTGSRRQSTSV